MPTLRITVAEDTREQEWDGRSECIVGRLKNCDLRVKGAGLSRQHCVLFPGPDGEPRLRDLGSSNGTRVNGKEIEETTLSPGDRIELGDVRVDFAPDADGAEEASSAAADDDEPPTEPDDAARVEELAEEVARETDEEGEDLPVDRRCPHCEALRRYPPDEDPIECGRCGERFRADGTPLEEEGGKATPPRGRRRRPGRKAVAAAAAAADRKKKKKKRKKKRKKPEAPDEGPEAGTRDEATDKKKEKKKKKEDEKKDEKKAAAKKEEDPEAAAKPTPDGARSEGASPANDRPARAATRDLVRRRGLASYARLWGFILAVVIVLGGGFWWVSSDPEIMGALRGLTGQEDPEAGQPDPAYEEFAALRSTEAPDVESIAQAYRHYASTHPDARYAADAERMARLLEAARSRGEEEQGEVLTVLREQAEAHLHEGRFGRAATIAAAVLGQDLAEDRESWRTFQETVLRRTDVELRGILARVEARLADETPADAIRVLQEALPRLEGTPAEREALDRLGDLVRDLRDESDSTELTGAEESTEPAEPETPEVSEEVRRLGRSARGAVRNLDLDRARELLADLQGRSMPPAELLWWLWFDGQVVRLAELRRSVLERARSGEGDPIPVDMTESLSGRLVDGDAETITIEIRLESGRRAGTMERDWSSLAPGQILRILQAGATTPHARLTCAFYGLTAGRSDDAHAHLARARRAEAALTDAFLAAWSREPIPADGYVVFEDRLVTPTERDRIVAERERAREAAEDALADAEEAAANERYRAILERARQLLDEGMYEEGRRVAAEVAERATGEVEAEARAMAEAVVLRHRTLVESGPPENRLDFYVLGDGYPLSNDLQRRFDRSADQVRRIVTEAEPWREYGAFVNIHALNLVSEDEGVSRRGARKDTACGGNIAGGEYTVDHGLVMTHLEGFPNDGQAICVGNGEASISTGGGGVVAVAKGSTGAVPHEIGHSLGQLGDEYTYDAGSGQPQGDGPSPDPIPTRVIGPNLVEGNVREELLEAAPWAHWLDGPNWTGAPCDLFEGGNYREHDVWRPQESCLMQGTTGEFCVRCMEVMVLGMYRFVDLVDRVQPASDEVRIADDEVIFRALTLRPRTHETEVSWTVAPAAEDGDGTTARGGDAEPVEETRRAPAAEGLVQEACQIEPGDLDPGRWVLTLEVRDPTPWVREDPEGRLTDRHTWVIEVE